MDRSACDPIQPACRAACVPLMACLLVISLLAGCGSVRDVYTVQPLPVAVRPGDESWGVEVSLEMTEAIHLAVINTSQEPVRIIWDDCAYLDVEGRSHRLLAVGGTQGAELSPRVPTSVAPGSRVDEVLHPASDRFSSGDDPLLPGRLSATHRKQGAMTGKTIGVFLVLERSGRRRTVTATYAITGVQKERRWW